MGKPVIRYCVIVVAALLFACNPGSDPDKIPLAKVGEKILFLSEVKGVIPNGISSEDSALLAEDYIKKWVRSELLIRKAEENLTPQQKDVSKELAEYRNSLIIYRYKKDLMLQKMDTVVTASEMETFYQENKANFNLNQNIVKAIFIKIPAEVAHPEQVKGLCDQITAQTITELQEYCLKFAANYHIGIDNWVDIGVILKNLPVEVEDEQQFLTRHHSFEMRDSGFYYLLHIVDYRLINSPAPLEYVSENIKSLILNKRKIDFLKKVEDDVYTEGLKNNKFKTFNYDKK